jgi:serine/threonine-protein kinase
VLGALLLLLVAAVFGLVPRERVSPAPRDVPPSLASLTPAPAVPVPASPVPSGPFSVTTTTLAARIESPLPAPPRPATASAPPAETVTTTTTTEPPVVRTSPAPDAATPPAIVLSVPSPPPATPEPAREGWLLVLAAPWADVTVDGRAVGMTPLARLRLAAGSHAVILSHPQYQPYTRRVDVRGGETTTIHLDFASEGVRR